MRGGEEGHDTEQHLQVEEGLGVTFSKSKKRRYWHLLSDNKQLLDEVEHDIMNYQYRGLCYLPKLKAEADNTGTRF